MLLERDTALKADEYPTTSSIIGKTNMDWDRRRNKQMVAWNGIIERKVEDIEVRRREDQLHHEGVRKPDLEKIRKEVREKVKDFEFSADGSLV